MPLPPGPITPAAPGESYRDPAQAPAARRAFTMHDRLWKHNRYVYPVVSRRSKGISIGVNLNPDKVCNFDCIYCSVDRTSPEAGLGAVAASDGAVPGAAAAPDGSAGAASASPAMSLPRVERDVDLAVLRQELGAMIKAVLAGDLYREDPFNKIPPALRRLNDIAFSGDGEPTTCPQFDAAVRLAAELVRAAGLSWGMRMTKLVLITNASMFHKPDVRATLSFLDENNGEIWAKLDAGTEAYFKLVDRSPVPFARVLENITWCCQTRPTVIQTLLMKVHGEGPSEVEVEEFAGRLAEIVEAGGRIKLVQLYTVARKPTEAYATALSAEQLEGVADVVRKNVPRVAVAIFP